MNHKDWQPKQHSRCPIKKSFHAAYIWHRHAFCSMTNTVRITHRAILLAHIYFAFRMSLCGLHPVPKPDTTIETTPVGLR